VLAKEKEKSARWLVGPPGAFFCPDVTAEWVGAYRSGCRRHSVNVDRQPHTKKAVACGGGYRFTPENPIQPAANAGTIRNENGGRFYDIGVLFVT